MSSTDHGGFPSGQQWTVHVPIVADSEESAVMVAALLAAELAHVPQVDERSVEVSRLDDQCGRRRQVFCNLLIPGGGRCAGGYKHPGFCRPVG